MMSPRVLVTGASGFIGRHAIAPLHTAGYEIHAIGRSDTRNPQVQFHYADLFDTAEIKRIVVDVQPTHLLHFAWNAEPGRFWNAPDNLDWVSASLHLVRMFREAGGQRAVISGTCAEYSWDGDGVLDEATTPLAPGTLYGSAKDGLHRIAEAYATTSGLSLAWGRIFFLYGPGEKPGRLVSDAIATLSAGQPFPTTDGLQLRDFMHVADVAGGFAALLDSPVTGPVNIASGKAIQVRALLEMVASRLGSTDLLQFGARPRAAQDPPLVEAAVSRLRDEVGFVPHRSFADYIAEIAR